MAKKIITVFGATGAQGGGLARAILNDPDSEFTVRAVTRNPDSDAAKALAAAGAEVVQADLQHPALVHKAMEGAYGAYCVTFFWEHFSVDREMAEAALMAEAAAANGLQHVIWSTLEDTRNFISLDDDRMPTLQGKYKVPHFDGKGSSDKKFTEAGVPTTFLLTAFYWENLLFFGMGPKRGEDGVLAITFPMADKKLAGIGAEDIGKCAYGIFKAGKSMIGETVGIMGDDPTCADMAASLTRALGEEVRYNAVPAEMYRSFGFPGADDLGNMFQFYAEFEEAFGANRNKQLSKQLNPDLQDFDQWLAANKHRMPID